MTAAQAVQVVLAVAEIVLRLLPPADQAKAKRELAKAFIDSKLADLDAYARGKRR